MSTNQENRHFTFKENHNPGGAAVVLEEDHLLAYTNAGAAAGNSFNGTRLDFINKSIPGTFAGLPEAMQAFAANAGATNWVSIGGKNSDEPALPIQGNSGISESGTQVRVAFDLNVSATAGQEGAGWNLWVGNREIGVDAAGSISGAVVTLTPKSGAVIKKTDRPILVYYDAGTGSLKGVDAPGLNVVSIWGLEIPNGSQQGVLGDGFAAGFAAGFDDGFD